LPLSDREYMRRTPQSSGGHRRRWNSGGFDLNPVMVLIAINFVFFIATMINGDLKNYLGLIPALFLERPWTILTNLFIHAGLWHILFNMIALFFFGRVLYQIVGQNRFLLVYFGGGILGNIVFMLLNATTGIPVVGASGAIYAIAGALVVIMPRVRVALWGVIPMPLWVFVIVFLGLLSLPPFAGGDIAWQAHMGGLAAGLIAGYLFKRRGRHFY
jgi:membrane associated rhomboid family serine protease